MKIELVKKTTAVYGREYYYINVEGLGMISDTWTSNYDEAIKHYEDVVEKCKQFPGDKKEVLQMIEI